MALADPRIHYITIRDAIIALLNDNSATLNTGLSGGNVKQIIGANPFTHPVPVTMYPSILIRLDRNTEEFKTIGGGRKEVILSFSIFGIVRVVTSGRNSDDEAMKFADNICAVFRDNININAAVAVAGPVSCEFGILENTNGVYVTAVQIKLDCLVILQ